MMRFLIPLLLGVLVTVTCALTRPATAMDKQIVGWVEMVRLQPENLLLKAKLDTGADNCSLDASNITNFERQGQTWVRFDVNDHDGKTTTMERPLVRMAPIKRHFGNTQRRPVIHLRVCVGKVSEETEVNLVDRSGFNYPMLIGRKFMQDRLIIDPTAKYTAEPICEEHPGSE
jgi:hypothetical protein